MNGIVTEIQLPDETPKRLTVWAVGGLLLLAVIAVFGQTARHSFINFDDDIYVYENRHVREGLTGEGIAWAFTQNSRAGLWIPLTWLSLMADAPVRRSGDHPLDHAQLATLAMGMHLVNVALHAANAVILFLVLRTMTASLWRSALVAAVFAVHPLHVESVAWITERKDVLSGLFGLLAIGAYARYARGPSAVRYLSVVVALALGLMAKPILVTWPLLFLLLDYWPLRRRCCAGLVLEKVPFVLLVAVSSIVTFLAHRSRGAVVALESAAISERIARAAVLYVAYLGKTFCPVNLAAVYPSGRIETYGPALGAGVLLALLTAGAFWGAWRGQRWLVVGWLWFLGTLVPTIGLVQVGLQVMADRFLYLPQIGLCVALVWGVGHVAAPRRRRRCSWATIAALLLAGLMVCAWQQTSYWQNSETLWTRALACTLRNPIANENFGCALAGRGEMDAAIAHFQEALEIKPDFAAAHHSLGCALAGRGDAAAAIVHYKKALEIKPDFAAAHYSLGAALAGRGEAAAAIAHYEKALDINPDYAEAHYSLGDALAGRGEAAAAIAHYEKALDINPDYAEAHYNLGVTLAERGEVATAIAHYRKALEIKPDYVEAHINLGCRLAEFGQVDEAIAHYTNALAIKPDFAAAHDNLGLALARRGQFAAAILHFRKALEIQPDLVDAYNNLGNALARCGQFDEAITDFQKALAIKPHFALAQYNLASALAGCERLDEALKNYQKALDLATAQNDMPLAEAIRAQIRLCQPAAPAGNTP